jgi:hypothetical protein
MADIVALVGDAHDAVSVFGKSVVTRRSLNGGNEESHSGKFT